MPKAYSLLKDRHRQDRDAWPSELSLRVHRSLSWLHCAEESKDEDSHFIYLWISFNAAYANDADDIRYGEGHRYKQFLSRLTTLDASRRLERLLWDQFSGPIRVLLKNKYVFQPFWDRVRNAGEELDWETQFKKAVSVCTDTKKARVRSSLIFECETRFSNPFDHLLQLRYMPSSPPRLKE